MSAAQDLTVFHRHGGRITAAEALFPHAPRPWLDLSTGINPRPYPAPALTWRNLARLPEPEALAALEAAAATVFGVAPTRVAATPGTEAALRLLPRLLGARSVALSPPIYGGHLEAWRAIGAEIVIGQDDPAEARVAVNPNNPDGRSLSAETLLAAAQTGWMIVDEAFADPHPEASVAAQAGGKLVVLRSFGKFYGLPGLRLGFVLAEPTLAAQIRQAFGEWPVSNGAILAGNAAYADAAWRERTRKRLRRDRARLDRLLERAGLTVLGGTDLFRLAQAADAETLFLSLCECGVLCRPFDQTNLLRFGLPGRRADWDRLAASLQKGRP
jgi:cobalamin biosynthetic protein CobC